MNFSAMEVIVVALFMCLSARQPSILPAFAANENVAAAGSVGNEKIETEENKTVEGEYDTRPFGEGIQAWSNKDYDLALNIFKAGAEKGSAPSMTALGYMYTTGNGAPLDQLQGIHWYKMAIAAGEPYAIFALSVYLRAYPEFQEHEGESLELLLAAVDKKLPVACQEYFRQLEQEGKLEEAQKILSECFAADQLWAVTVRGIGLVTGEWGEKDLTGGIELLKKAADRGEISALYHAAKAEFELGNSEQGEKLHLEAVKNSYAPSMFELGKIYASRGELDKSIKILEDAGLEGFTPAYIQLGRIFEEGKYLTQDLVKAARYYKMAADVEDPAGCNEYGRLVELGRGVKKSLEISYDLYASGAVGGSLEALFNQGRMEFFGLGTAQNTKSGLAKMINSSRLGCSQATAVLASMYKSGKYLDRNDKEAKKLYDLAVSQGDPYATFYVANDLLKSGETQRYDEAKEMLQKASETEYYPAQFALATLLVDDTHHAPDFVSALSLYTSAAEAGFPPAMCAMGLIKLGASKTEAEMNAARNQIIASAEAGYLPAEYALGQISELGGLGKHDYRKAIAHYKQGAEGGNALSLIRLASIALNGEFGSTPNYEEAFKYYLAAAELGDATAQANLALLYLTGKGVSRDDQKAFMWYQRAADGGNVVAKYNVAMMKMNAVGTWKNASEAIKLLQVCAENGYALAQNELALLYARGVEIPRSFENARLMFSAAAEAGYVPAYYNLGLLYTYSPEGEGDPAAAISCFEQASMHGHALATWHLGSAYEEGRGVEKDLLRAQQYYLVAEARGEKRAKEALKRLKSITK